MAKNKKYKAALEKVDRHNEYGVQEAIALAKEISYANFDETVDLSYNLNIDVRQADQQIRGAMVLPHGTGKTQTVVVIASGDKAQEAKDAGADYVGEGDLIAKIDGGWLDFDVLVATPDMMGQVGRLGRVLGPKGLMPNPKTGTVTADVSKAVSDIKAGQVQYRADKAGIVNVPIGKVSFTEEQLAENIKALQDRIVSLRPAAVKGNFILSATLSTTMGPGIKVGFTKPEEKK
ncbi:50S ribosomal protein L1 [Aerococcaceae bacterium DSM 111020]|nr:50S ribosomal protein L1 [Aerococcaceae bacterium DSM 111020]